MTTTQSRQVRGMIRAACWVLFMAATVAQAAVEGAIFKTGDEQRPIEGSIRWRAASKEYAVTTKDNSVMLSIPLDEVGGMRIKRPANLDGLINQVRQGQFSPAIPGLEAIVEEYTMLQYDMDAGAALARAYMGNKDPKKAAATCEKVLADKPEQTISRELVDAYWDALLDTEQYARLREQLSKAIETGNREVAAQAHNKRGDIDFKRGDPKTALMDGYLRTVTLFRDVKAVQPEALYKAYLCFDKLGQNSHKDKMRKRLMQEFASSPQAQQVR